MDGSITYKQKISSTEKNTGKTYGGKYVYCKEIVLDDNSIGQFTINHNIANIDTPLKIYGTCGAQSNKEMAIPAKYNETTFIVFGGFSRTDFTIYKGPDNWGALNKYSIVLEYTKN